MPNRTFKLAAAALSLVLGSLTPSFAQQAAPAQPTVPAQQAATDACQPAPKGAAPQGKHWYYHTDRSAGRKCWYLGDAGLTTTTSQAKSAPAADSKPVSHQDLEARAEAPAPPESNSSNATGTETTPDTAETSEPATTQTTPDGIASAPLLTERWPEADAFRPSQTTNAATPLENAQPTNLQPANTQAASPPPAAAPSPSPQPATTSPSPKADSSEQPASLSSWRTILGALFIALGFAGLLGFITFRYFGRTGDTARATPNRRRDIWGDNADETPQRSPSYEEMIAPSRWASAARASRAPQDLDEIEQLLRRAVRGPAPANSNSQADPATRARTPTAPSAARASTAQHAGSFRPR